MTRAVICREFGPADSVEIGEITLAPPAEGEVQVRIEAAGVNFPDTLMVQGKYQVRPPLPFVPGAEMAGCVLAVGPGVTHLTPGMDVVGMVGLGAFAEAQNFKAARVLARPAAMDAATAAGFSMTYGTSMHALRQRADLKAGETLLVLGAAGGVGLAAVELGKAIGARVIACASSAEKLEVARRAGADHLINYSETSLKDAVRAICGPEGVDVVYDPVGGPLLEEAVRVTGWRGRILVVGFAGGEIPKIPANLLLLKGSALVGVFFGTFRDKEPEANLENFRQMFSWFEEGRLSPLISDRLPLDQVTTAFALLSGRKAIGKVVLLP